MSEITMTLSGDREVVRMFEELPTRAQKHVLTPLLKMGSKMLSHAEKSEAPHASGLLGLAIGASKLRTYESTIFITAGVRRGFRRAVTRKARGGVKRLGKAKTAASPDLPAQDPVRYAHLVSGGRKAVSVVRSKVLYDPRSGKFFGRHVKGVAPNPFVDRAFDRTKTSVLEMIVHEAPDRICAEASKLANSR
jgi:hypothetical protein